MGLGNFRKLGLTLGPVEEEGFESGSEFFGLGFPVPDDGGGSENEGRELVGAAAGDLGLQVGEGLQGLAKAHIIGEDPVESVASEELHPVEAIKLVVAEIRLNRFGWLGPGKGRDVFEIFAEGGEILEGLAGVHFKDVREGGGLEAVEGFLRRIGAEEIVQGFRKTEEAEGREGEEGIRRVGVPEEGLVIVP